MIRKNSLQQLLFLTLSVVLSGCSLASHNTTSERTPPQVNQTATGVATPNSSHTPVRTPLLLLPTFPPTINPTQESYVRSLLQSTDCKLPCYMGITPGRTSWADAQSILNEIGAISEGAPYQTKAGMSEFGYDFYIGDPTLTNATRPPNLAVGDMEIAGGLNITVGSDLVQRLDASAQTIKFVDKFNQYWAGYSLSSIFKQLGPPSMVFFAISNQAGIYLESIVYPDLGIMVSTDGIMTGQMICPTLAVNGALKY